MSDCHTDNTDHSCHDHQGRDWLLLGCGSIVALGLLLAMIGGDRLATLPPLAHFSHAVTNLAGQMWWGVLLGIIFVGLLQHVPKEALHAVLGNGDRFSGIFRATLAGVLLDLCSHGILMVGMKLYERGASLGQIMAFLIASPWNSLSLTFIMVALIGLPWTLAFIGLSLVIALVSGVVFQTLVKRGTLPANPNRLDLPEPVSLREAWLMVKPKNRPSLPTLKTTLYEGMLESRMVLRWLLFGLVLAALIRAFMPTDMFQEWFGPTLLGIWLTLIATTIIEVCSEGSTPIAADLMNRANAPGNSFVFLMGGVATDYTEVMTIKDTMRSWKIALFLPLVTLPQVIVIGMVLNQL